MDDYGAKIIKLIDLIFITLFTADNKNRHQAVFTRLIATHYANKLEAYSNAFL